MYIPYFSFIVMLPTYVMLTLVFGLLYNFFYYKKAFQFKNIGFALLIGILLSGISWSIEFLAVTTHRFGFILAHVFLPLLWCAGYIVVSFVIVKFSDKKELEEEKLLVWGKKL